MTSIGISEIELIEAIKQNIITKVWAGNPKFMLTAQVEALDKAIQALTEMRDREIGCAVCKGRYRDENVSDNYCSGCGKHLPTQGGTR